MKSFLFKMALNTPKILEKVTDFKRNTLQLSTSKGTKYTYLS